MAGTRALLRTASLLIRKVLSSLSGQATTAKARESSFTCGAP
jgi:hypothetical protein